MTWLDASKYEHIPIEGAAGVYVEGTNYKFVNHTTEGPPGSIAGTISLFKARPASCPHLMIDPLGTRRRIQHIRLSRSACALKGGISGWQTNRAHALQMEIVGYARDAGDWPEEALWQIADVIADVIRAGYPINLDNVPDATLLRGTLATASAPQRFSGAAWHDFDGLASHVYVPFNDHWDAGTLDARRVAAMAKEILGGGEGPFIRPSDSGGTGGAPAVDYIARGMAGGHVRFIQQLIAGLGYDLGPAGDDGDFGPATEDAVKAFQRDNGLDPDGIVGPATSAALSKAYCDFHSGVPPIPPPAPPETGYPAWPGRFLVLRRPYLTGEDIRTWQRQMDARGWRIAVDGVYGDRSAEVCERFQREKGLTVDGIVGPQTWAAAWTAPVT